ncbi:phage tail protein [Kosakonia radicincitans]|uniref:phage tail protein n=1 Tax=Kosakonia radicincitans TaxID=283686 RepID=UPI001D067DFC|nr:phage tail protein [Kosakonia radicincitans]
MKRREILKYSALFLTGLFASKSPALADTITPVASVNTDSLPKSVVVVDDPAYNGDLQLAYKSNPGSTTFLLGNGDYNVVGLWNDIRNTKENILIIGLGMPQLSDDKSRFVSGSGTVIQGAVKNQARGFKVFNLGIDCGNYVSQNLYHAINNGNPKYEDALQIYGVGSNANIGIDNVKTLNSIGVSSMPATHSILLEQLEGAVVGYVECIGGFHGYTVKCQNLRGGHANCYGQYGDAFILKSDSGGMCRDIVMEGITVGRADNTGWPAPSMGGLYDAHDNVTIDNIRIGFLRVQNAAWGFRSDGNSTGYIKNIMIGDYYANTVYGNNFTLEVSDKCVNWNIGEHNCTFVSGGIKVSPKSVNINISDGRVTDSTRAGYSLGGNTLCHGTLISNGNYQGVEYTGGTGLNIEKIIAYKNTNGNFSSLPSVLASGPLNGWVPTAQIGFKATPCGHKVVISGSLNKGTGANAYLIAENMRPPEDIYIPAFGINAPLGEGGSMVPVEVWVRTTGYIEISGWNSLGVSQPVRINGSYLIA